MFKTSKYYLRNILGSCLLLVLVQFSASAQVEATVTIANENAVGSDYYFDLYIHEATGSSGSVYLADAQFRISFNIGNFNTADLALTQASNLGIFGQEDGFSTLVPENSDGAANDYFTRTTYLNGTSLTIPPEKNNILNIELDGPGPGNATALSNGVAKIDDKQLTHRLGRYKIAGYKGTGGADLTLIYGGGFGTALLSYDPADLTPPIFETSVVTLNTGTLPVEWISFTAEEINYQEVKLEWVTGAELNNDRFEIEKQLKHGEFQKIGEVASPGNSVNPRVYQYFDNTPMTSKVFYRIKQVDFDGTFEYSTTVEVNFDFNGNDAYTVYPTPAEKEITIEALNETQLSHEFWIVDLQGKEISKGEIEAGASYQKVDISELSVGNYFIKIKSPKEEIFHLKFVKE